MKSGDTYVVMGVHFGHDAGAAIVVNGQVVADISEECFNRVKHSSDYPLSSIDFCLKAAGVSIREVDEIAVAGLKVGDSFRSVFGQDIPGAIESLTWRQRTYYFKKFLLEFVKKTEEEGIKTPIESRGFFLERLPKVTQVDHHLAHAAGAYYTANDRSKMIIATVDGIGDGKSSCIWLGDNGRITPLVSYGGESSIGWFYSNVTEALGWWHGDGEGKTMGLAPYGDFNKCKGVLDEFYPKFKDGMLAEPYNFSPFLAYKQSGAIHWHSDDALRIAEIVKKYGKENIAAEAQRILEKEVMNFVMPWLAKTGTDTLATSGGVFLNVKLNQRIWMSGKVKKHHPYPNPGDAGLALGAAIYASAQGGILVSELKSDLYLGPEFSNKEIKDILDRRGIDYRLVKNAAKEAAKYLAKDKIVAWFQGRMESGPRALGNRSILMSPKKAENKDIINARVKFREAFRPFCPSLTEEAKDDYLVNARLESFMITSFDCKPERKKELPAVVHTDGTLRPQTVIRSDNPKYWELINAFGKLTGTPVVLNTSMNIRGEPVVCSPREALRCFFDSGIDVLILGDYIIEKSRVPKH